MNQKLILIWAFSLSVLSAFAQKTITYKEDFKDNKRAWLEADNHKRSAKITDGYYNLNYKQETGSSYFWKVIYIDQQKDFYIETKVRHMEGALNRGFGLVWGTKNVDNSYSFQISDNGYFRIKQQKGGVISKIKDWTASAKVYPNGDANVLAIRSKAGKIDFMINGAVVHTRSKLEFMGGYIGFIISGKQKIKADYLHIYQDDIEINLAPNVNKKYVSRQNLGMLVNSTESDIMPVISADGNTLFFTRKKDPMNIGKITKDDIWLTHKQGNTWMQSQNFGRPINNEGHNQLISISPDNNTVVVGNTYHPDGSVKGSGVSMAQKINGKWEIPKTVYIKDYYNLSKYHAFCLSSDGNILLMAIERKDSKGEQDIYVSFKTPDGFTAPQTLGPTINTLYQENAPFLAADNKTLYYSSAGQPGYGSNDIFITKRLDDTWKRWSKPQNLGPIVNSPVWDNYFTVPASGKVAYVSSRENAATKADLFEITLPKSIRPDPVVLIKGRILHADTKADIPASVTYYDLKTGEDLGTANVDLSTGKYQIILPYGKKYGIYADKDNFYGVSTALDLVEMKEYEERNVDLIMEPLDIGNEILLNNMGYKTAKAELQLFSDYELKRLEETLINSSEMKIEIQGHLSQAEPLNQNNLSELRAKSTRQYLIRNGINTERILAKGYGNTKPLNANKTKEEQALNRRTSFKILPKKEIVNNDTPKPDPPKTDDTDKNTVAFDTENIKVEKLEVGQKFRLEKLYFAADSSNITSNTKKALAELISFLKTHKHISIEIGGHTNGLPKHDYCDWLSDARAMAIGKYLIAQGVQAEQITYKGYGKRQPIASNDTMAGRKLNQRVEVKITNIDGK
ncbi:MAG: OmpA family protein [Saprospiraceae bacterium]|nr:OmpA family protein [Saprospiraceae bacterium]